MKPLALSKASCPDCEQGVELAPDFLFDPLVLACVDRVRKKTSGRFRWHHHLVRVFGTRSIAHSFNVYEIGDRGLLAVVETTWSRDIEQAVSFVDRIKLPALWECERHGL